MALSIQSNMASLSIQNQLGRSNNDLSTALERLGSGFRINSAKDDAAGLQIANRLSAQVVGQDAALYNTSNAMSLLETGEGAFEEMTNITFRMKELATQAANGTNNESEYTALNSEFTALKAELTNIMDNTTYGSGTNLFEAGTAAVGAVGTTAAIPATPAGKLAGGVTFQIGANTSETLAFDVSTEVTALRTSVAAATTPAAGTAAAVYPNGAVGDLAFTTDTATSVANAQVQMGQIDTLINNIGTARSSMGATMNRLEHTMNNVTNMKENSQAAISNLMDADYAAETSNMTKQQLLMNSGISVLSTSNSTTQMIGSLLR